MQEDAEKRVETERATTTEVHARLATAREEAQRTLVAEAEETERLRAELERTREDGERLLAAERAEVARLREELLNSERLDEEPDEASRRMVERITRDLERERATSRNLRRELDDLRSESAEHRRAVSSATANGTLAMDDAARAGDRGGPQRPDAARHAAPRRRRPRRRRVARAAGPAVAGRAVGGPDPRRGRRRGARHRARRARLGADVIRDLDRGRASRAASCARASQSVRWSAARSPWPRSRCWLRTRSRSIRWPGSCGAARPRGSRSTPRADRRGSRFRSCSRRRSRSPAALRRRCG